MQQWVSDLLSISQASSLVEGTIQRTFNEFLYDNNIYIGGQGSFEIFASGDINYFLQFNKVESIVADFKTVSPYTTEFDRIICNHSSNAFLILNSLIMMRTYSVGNQTAFLCSGHMWIIAKCPSSLIRMCVDCNDPCSYSMVTDNAVFPYPCSINGGCIHTLTASFANTIAASEISDIIIDDVTISSVSVSVSVLGPASSIYCAAIQSTLVLQSMSTILQGQSASISKGSSSASMIIGGLLPSTKYRLYCTTLSYSKATLPILTVINQSVAIETSCCKTLSVDLMNRFLLPGYSYVDAILISLSTVPLDDLIIVIAIDDNPGIIVSPQILKFTSTAKLGPEGGLYISLYCSSKVRLGRYDLNVTLIGTSALGYSISYSSNNSIQIVDSTFIGPAPSFLSAVLNPFETVITVTLRDNTNKAGLTDNFPCIKLLNFSSAAGSECRWTDSSTIQILLASVSSISPGDTIRWAQRSSNTSLLVVEQPTGVDFPNWPSINYDEIITVESSEKDVIPTVFAIGPSYVSLCSALIIDLSTTTGIVGERGLNSP